MTPRPYCEMHQSADTQGPLFSWTPQSTFQGQVCALSAAETAVSNGFLAARNTGCVVWHCESRHVGTAGAGLRCVSAARACAKHAVRNGELRTLDSRLSYTRSL